MKAERANELLINAKYKFARSMPRWPHWYTLKDNWENKEDFEAVVRFIREYGVEEFFFKKQHTYYYLEGFKYWTMGNPVEQTILINKAKQE